MNTEEQIIAALSKSGDALSAGQLVDATGIDRKEIDKAMKNLKAKGRIVSPKKCYWTVG